MTSYHKWKLISLRPKQVQVQSEPPEEPEYWVLRHPEGAFYWCAGLVPEVNWTPNIDYAKKFSNQTTAELVSKMLLAAPVVQGIFSGGRVQ